MSSERFNTAFEFLLHTEEIIEHGYEDRMMALEADFNRTVDECVGYGSFPYEKGEEMKRQHHEQLWRHLGHTAMEA